MKKAADILFNTLIDGKSLFKNQIDLVNALLNTEGSDYFIDPSASQENIARAQGRLKTYISQLLSDTVVRNITEDLKRSVDLILSSRLTEPTKSYILQEIVSAINEKNTSLTSVPDNAQVIGGRNVLEEDIKKANYISVFTSRPIDMDTPEADPGFSIRKYFFLDLLNTLTTHVDKAKYYRFNFPMPTYGQLFWLGLEKILIRYLENTDSKEIMSAIYENSFSITTETIAAYEKYIEKKNVEGGSPEVMNIGKELRQTIAKEIIERLNRNKVIMVFTLDEPIFTLPLIVINPNESTSKVYALLDIEEKRNIPYKFTSDNTLLWRIFVWDKIKAKNRGVSVTYKEVIEKRPQI